MSTTAVERAAYKAPEIYSTLANSWRLKEDLTRPGYIGNLPRLAEELGFVRVDDFPTKKGAWHLFDRPNQDVPNFSHEPTRISSSLAVYEKGGEFSQAILRTSKEPYGQDELRGDLDGFIKHYVERPNLLGFPSRKLTAAKLIFGGLAIGILGAGAATYYALGGDINDPRILGVVVGEVGGAGIGGTWYALAERHAKRSISDLEQYSAGDGVRNLLEGERYHRVRVDLQTEWFNALRAEDPSLEPDGFLEKIYAQTPQTLLSKRHAEIEIGKFPRTSSVAPNGNSLPRLVEVAHTLKSVEDYLRRASELKQGLAGI